MVIEVKAPKANRELTVEYDFGGNLDAAVAAYGSELVYNGFEDSAVIALQNRVRAWLAAGLSEEDIHAKVAEWKPGVKAPRTGGVKKDPIAAFKAAFANMSEEEKAAMIRDLKASLQPA